ncbi:MAG: 16S rRNA (adenine(1518)-N(6)/adenine(1519)-N(6))-dimethyltransferase RsmA [Burkholderiaceae bacterium]
MSEKLEGHRARKRFGQNFLHDIHWIARIVAAIDPRPGQNLIEIGPGQAALTRELIKGAGHVSAVEIDRDLAAWLRTQFTEEQLTLIQADALKYDWRGLVDQAPVRIVGNLPYNISSPLLFELAEVADGVIDQHFMLQKEVVDRMVAGPGSKTYGRLSVMLQYHYTLRKMFDVPPGAFNPAPQVTSSIVRMIPKPASEIEPVDPKVFSRVVAAAFGQRRKTLRNALSEVMNEEAIRAAGVEPGARAETLDLKAFVRLAQVAASLPPAA